MDADFFGGEPFDAAGETESAARAGKRTEPVAQKRPGAALFGEAVVIVRLAVMDVTADTFALAVGVVELPRDVAAGIILEQFRVGPLHAGLGQ